MKKTLAVVVGIIALIAFPVLSVAKSHMKEHGGGKGGNHAPAPNRSAYEHAGGKAGFQRDTHDMGRHQGQNEQNMDKEKDKARDDEKGMEKKMSPGKDKGKETDSQAVGDKEKGGKNLGDKVQQLEADKEKLKQKAGGGTGKRPN